MAYSTPALVRKALVPTSDGTLPTEPTLTAADLSDPQLDDAIAEADAIIDGYLANRYTVPVAQVEGAIPHPVDYWSRSLAAYLATCSYRGSMDFTDQDPVSRRQIETMSLLKAVAKGDMTLNLPVAEDPDGNPTGGTAGAPFNPYQGELFTPEDFEVNGPIWPQGVDHWHGGW